MIVCLTDFFWCFTRFCGNNRTWICKASPVNMFQIKLNIDIQFYQKPIYYILGAKELFISNHAAIFTVQAWTAERFCMRMEAPYLWGPPFKLPVLPSPLSLLFSYIPYRFNADTQDFVNGKSHRIRKGSVMQHFHATFQLCRETEMNLAKRLPSWPQPPLPHPQHPTHTHTPQTHTTPTCTQFIQILMHKHIHSY